MSDGIYKRGKSWLIKFDAPPGPDGKRRQRYATFKGTFAEAKKERARLLSAVDSGILPEPTTMTLADYIAAWLDSAHEQAPKTLERYRELAMHQISPHLGGIKLQKLRPEHIQGWHSA
jgi:hypothetical protein